MSSLPSALPLLVGQLCMSSLPSTLPLLVGQLCVLLFALPLLMTYLTFLTEEELLIAVSSTFL